ncbi:hypothetical protein L596_017633 [Steinernema carpocapsae]|uniref:Uncharacterized protein n=1 Tax=Steinernema carpocapsae TaxID=34508 RepID=A0A4U5N2K3_STECR|nr:hypothetical protein L596_017633 [Steinernema carpocapsae]
MGPGHDPEAITIVKEVSVDRESLKPTKTVVEVCVAHQHDFYFDTTKKKCLPSVFGAEAIRPVRHSIHQKIPDFHKSLEASKPCGQFKTPACR